MKGVFGTDELTGHYQLNLQLTSALQSFIETFSSLIVCPDHSYTALPPSHSPRDAVFSHSRKLFS